MQVHAFNPNPHCPVLAKDGEGFGTEGTEFTVLLVGLVHQNAEITKKLETCQ